MNATAKLWYGIWNPTVEERVQLEVEEPADGGYEKVVDGVHIDFIYVYDNRVGLGGIAAHSWWAENDKPVDLAEIDRVKVAVDKFLDEYGVPGGARCLPHGGLHMTGGFSLRARVASTLTTAKRSSPASASASASGARWER